MQKWNAEWGERASAQEHERYVAPIPPRSRRRCYCGCGKRATHLGMANGIALVSGCELFVYRWRRDPMAGLRRPKAT